MPTAATVSAATETQYDFLVSFAKGCPDFPYGEAGVVKGVNAKEGQTMYDYITEFFDDDMGTEDFDTVEEIHLNRFSNTNLSVMCDFGVPGAYKPYPGLYPQEAYALTALARMSVNKTLTNLKGVLGEKFSKESTEDWVKTLYTKGNKGYCIGMWRLLALTHYLNSGVREEPDLCCALAPKTEMIDTNVGIDHMLEKVVVKTKKTKKNPISKSEEINMDMIKEFISKATTAQIKELSKSCMDRQTECANFTPNVGELVGSYEGSTVLFSRPGRIETTPKCPEGWIESEINGVAFWENEEDGKLVAPCEDVNNPECIGEWNKDCDDIIW